MGTALGKRTTAKEATDILGVPAHQISRLDVEGRFIKRFKLTRKTQRLRPAIAVRLTRIMPIETIT